MSVVETQPGDIVGQDEYGRILVDRRIPLQWLLGILGVVALQAVLMYARQETQTEKISELTVEMKAMRVATSGMSERVLEHTMRLAEHDRRMSEMALHIERLSTKAAK